MRPPIEIFAALLLMETIRLAGGRYLPAPTLRDAAWSIAWIVLYWLSCWAYFRILAQVSLRRLQREGAQRSQVANSQRPYAVAGLTGMVLGYGSLLWFSRWADVVQDWLDLKRVPLVPELFLLAPFVVGMVMVWAGFWPLAARQAGIGSQAGERKWGVIHYIGHQARHGLVILIPWVFIVAVAGFADWLPERMGWKGLPPEAGAGLGVALLAAIVLVLFPAGAAWFWGAGPLPDGDLRRGFAELAGAVGLRFRRLLLWKSGRFPFYNACILGLWGRFRYVLITRGLMEALPPEGALAVLAHEMGHAKHRHLISYFFFALGYVLLCSAVAGAMPEAWRDDPLVYGAVFLALLIPYWRLGFGFVSRAFERQADLASAEMMGTPAPLANALERIAALTGDTRDVRCWHHDSVARRVERLMTEGADPQAIARFHARVRRGIMIGALVLAALIAANSVLAWRELADGHPVPDRAAQERDREP